MVDLPRTERLNWLIERSAALLAGGAEPVNGLILPTGHFFPDTFDGGRQGVRKLLKRVVKHAGLSDISISLNIPKPDEELLSGGGGCASGACSTSAPKEPSAPREQRSQRILETKEGYAVTILPQEVSNPTVLTVAMVRAVSHIFLKETELYDSFDVGEGEFAIDLVGTMLGFGVLLANGAYLYSKG